MAKKPHNNSTDKKSSKSISVRDVDVSTWRDFRKLAMLHDMTLSDYLKFIVDQEMENVSISTKSK